MALRTRIVAWFMLLTAALLLVFAAGTNRALREERERALDASLAARAAALAALVECDHGEYEAEFVGEMAPSEELLGDLLGYEVVVPPDDEVLFRSEGMGESLRRVSIPPSTGQMDVPEERPHAMSTSRGTVTVEGEAVRVYSAVFAVRQDGPLPDGGIAVAAITVAESRAGVDDTLSSLTVVMAYVGAAVLFLSLLAGWMLANRIAKPLEAIADRAEQVQAGEPGATVPVTGSGDEIDRLASTLNATFARLLDAYERQARFTADASHELRTPVSIIRTQAEVALRRTRTAEEYQHALVAIVEGSERIGDTLEGLLLLARADAGGTEPVRERVDLRAPARAALDEEAAAAAERKLELVLQAGDPVEVAGDSRQLQTAIRNLLSNAVRHGEGPGEVTVRLLVEGDDAVIEVEDRGEGIPADQLDRVFERFYRVDRARSRARGGAGLGLSIVQTIAAQHGGSVSADSVLGEGTVVRIKLPRA